MKVVSGYLYTYVSLQEMVHALFRWFRIGVNTQQQADGLRIFSCNIGAVSWQTIPCCPAVRGK